MYSQVIPRASDVATSLNELRHCGLTSDGRVLVVEGAEAEELLKELLCAD